jgi:cytochrome c
MQSRRSTLHGDFRPRIRACPGYNFSGSAQEARYRWTPETVGEAVRDRADAIYTRTKMPEQTIGFAEDRDRAGCSFHSKATK